MTPCPSGIRGQNALVSILLEMHWISSLMVLGRKSNWKSLSLFRVGKYDKQSNVSLTKNIIENVESESKWFWKYTLPFLIKLHTIDCPFHKI